MGCFHFQYILDGKIIAISVADILPKGFSSYYFFWDPDYKKLSLGIVSAVNELKYVRDMYKEFPKFKYYYMGWYIQSSSKMVYKN